MAAGKKPFKIVIALYIIIYAAACIWGAAVPAYGNSYERGGTIYFPKEGSIVSGEFKVNGSVFAKDGVKSAYLVLEGAQGKKNYEISRETITYKGETLLTLSTFKNSIQAQNGTYNIFIELTDEKGGDFYIS